MLNLSAQTVQFLNITYFDYIFLKMPSIVWKISIISFCAFNLFEVVEMHFQAGIFQCSNFSKEEIGNRNSSEIVLNDGLGKILATCLYF